METLKIGKYDFAYIETIEPIYKNETVEKFLPQNKYNNKKNLLLHEYGNKDFCKFKLQNAKNVSGVYAWVIQGECVPVYIGEAKNLKKRFNMGYGTISPRNCFVGGQKTNCKMNNVVFKTYTNGQKIDIYFYETKEYKAVEKELLDYIITPYNVKNNKR